MDIFEVPQDNIEVFLTNEFNINIYDDLFGKRSIEERIFEPLEFFNLLYTEFDFFQKNATRYLTIKDRYDNLNLNVKQRYHLLQVLEMLIYDNYPTRKVYYDSEGQTRTREVILKSCEYIGSAMLDARSEMFGVDHKELLEDNEKRFEFFWVKDKIDRFTLTAEKIKFLIEIKTEYLQNRSPFIMDYGPTFDEQCDLEIKKLKELLEIESKIEQPVVNNKGKNSFNDSLTTKQKILVIYYFLAANNLTPRDKIDISVAARFLHLITGQEFKDLHRSEIYKHFKKAPLFGSDKQLTADLKAIKPLFEKVGLNEVIKLIDEAMKESHKESRNIRAGI